MMRVRDGHLQQGGGRLLGGVGDTAILRHGCPALLLGHDRAVLAWGGGGMRTYTWGHMEGRGAGAGVALREKDGLTFSGLLGQLWDDELVVSLSRVCIVRAAAGDGWAGGVGLAGADVVEGGRRRALLEELLPEEVHELTRQSTRVRCLLCTALVAAIAGGGGEGKEMKHSAHGIGWRGGLYSSPPVLLVLLTCSACNGLQTSSPSYTQHRCGESGMSLP